MSKLSFRLHERPGGAMAPFGGAHMSSAKAFFHEGLKRDHRNELTPAQVERFDRVAPEAGGGNAPTGWRRAKTSSARWR